MITDEIIEEYENEYINNDNVDYADGDSEKSNESLDDNEDDDNVEDNVYTIEQSEIGNTFNQRNDAINSATYNEIKTVPTIFKDTDDTNNDDLDDEINDVKMTVTIVAGFPSEEEYEKGDGKRLSEGPKAQNYYKFEYQLMPDEPETTITEVVTYKIAAKIFPDKEEPRVVKTWETDSQVWVAWNKTHELKLNKSRLLKMFDHDFIVKIWDAKEYCSARTKFDKPKGFKFPQPKPGENLDDLNEVKNIVIKQCSNYLRFIPKELHNKLERELPTQKKQKEPQDIVTKPNAGISNTLVAVSNKVIASQRVANKLSELAADTELLKTKRSKDEARATSVASSMRSENAINKVKKTKEKNRKEIANEFEHIKKNGVTQLKLKMKVLFADYKFVTVRLDKPIQVLEDCFVTITLETNLMSNRQLETLNPMMIKIDKLIDLPEKPLDYHQLREKCELVYCSYKFLKQPIYKTDGRLHENVIYYNDINVFLAGMIDSEELREYLSGAPFEIEIHDRDRKPNNKSQTPCIFGNEANDENISNVNAVASQKTIYNPFETRNKYWDPYGVAKLGLEEFLQGKKLVEYFLPISPCSAPEVNGRVSVKSVVSKAPTSMSVYSQTTANAVNTKGNQNDSQSMQAGGYLEANSHIYITVSIAKPLNSTEELVAKSRMTSVRTIASSTCVFGRLVCVFDESKTQLVSLIFNMIKKINSNSLNFAEYSSDVQEAALSTYKLNDEEQKSKTLNIITGFHLLDGRIHIIILEGLKNFGLREIYDSIPCKKENGIKILYNSSMAFSNRLYASLDVDLLRIKLFEPLEDLVKKPLLYIRDMAPKPGVDALLKLFQFTWIERLRDATRCDIFPSAEMIVSMSREFGAPLNQDELDKFKAMDYYNEETNNGTHNIYLTNSNVMIPHTSKVWTPIDNYNENFFQSKQENTSAKNFVKLNKEIIHDKSELNKVKKETNPVKYLVIEKPIYNYSSQKLNTTNAAILEFRNSLRNSSTKSLFTFNTEFHHSMTFSPIDIDELKKEETIKNKKKWLTKNGWTPRGSKSAVESNEHPRKPDIATIEKLEMPWEENTLHGNILKSPLERLPYKWEARTNDFNTWEKPNEKKYENIPVTIFDAGTKKEMEEKKLAKKEKHKWQQHLVVEDPNLKTHRVLPSTETLKSGPKCNNQLDKLKGLLKDNPKKKGLLHKNVDFNSIPALHVHVDTKDYDKENTKYGLKPGDSMNMRITDYKNVIPLHENERKKYIDKKNQDFELVHTDRTKLHKRLAKPLTMEEKSRFSEYYHSPYYQMTKFEMPNENDLKHIINIQKQKDHKKPAITT